MSGITFFLSKYCSDLNQIAPEWHQVKTYELTGQMFEDELDLAHAVIDGFEARVEKAGHSVE